MAQSAENLIWIDLEMTGLDPQTDHIIEIATVITGKDLDVLADGPALAIQCDATVLAGMDDWNQTQHGKSGLLERVKNSRVDVAAAERRTIDFLRQWVPPGASPMCGNSICQDRRFLARLMPDLETFFHYRNLDVSTVKELVARWAAQMPKWEKESRHLALEDIRDSIAELRHYRETVFRI